MVAAVVGVLFLITNYFITSPEAASVINNRHFQAASIFVLFAWLASLNWRYTNPRMLRIVSSALLVLIGAGCALWIDSLSHIKPLDVRITFDDSIDFPPVEMVRLVALLQSESLNVRINDKAILVDVTEDEKITDIEVQQSLNRFDEDNQNKVFTVLLTARNLKDSDWSNLLMISWPDSAVISTWGVGDKSSMQELSVKKYVATSIVLEALVSADKHQTSVRTVVSELKKNGEFVLEYEVRNETRRIKVFKLKHLQLKPVWAAAVDVMPNTAIFTARGTELLDRLNAQICEYCGIDTGYFEVHHVRKLSDIEPGKTPWEKQMIARKRKTMVLCVECHRQLTNGTLPSWKRSIYSEVESRMM